MIRKLLRLTPYVRREARGLAGVIGLTLAMSLLGAAQPWPLKVLVDYALGDASAESVPEFLSSLRSTTLVLLAAAVALALGVASVLLTAVMTWVSSLTSERMTRRLSVDLFDRLQRLSLKFHNRSDTGDAITRVTSDAHCVGRITDALLISPVHAFSTLAFISVVAWNLDSLLTIVLLAVTPALILFAWYFGPRIRHQSRARRESRARLTGFIQQTLSSMPVVQAFNAQSRNDRRFNELADDLTTAVRRSSGADDLFKLINGLGTTTVVAIVIFLGGRRVLQNELTVGSLLVFLQYGRMMLSSIRELLGVYGKLLTNEVSVDRVLEVLDSLEEVPEPAQPALMPKSECEHGSRVSFENVTFGYDPELPVLQDIMLEVEPGETVALVGATGAGKTTLVSLIPRFFDPQGGVVRIDGVNLRELRLAELRNRVALVLQQPFLMPLSIAENIAYGCPDASMERIVNAARVANADGFIRALPGGYETVLGERGGGLSGGERQRIAIARAILNDASVVILDEPTAALDTETELVVMDAISRMTADRTTFIIAHRLSTARRADRIVVLSNGRIVETGSHAELITRVNGAYRELHELQTLAPGREADA